MPHVVRLIGWILRSKMRCYEASRYSHWNVTKLCFYPLNLFVLFALLESSFAAEFPYPLPVGKKRFESTESGNLNRSKRIT